MGKFTAIINTFSNQDISEISRDGATRPQAINENTDFNVTISGPDIEDNPTNNFIYQDAKGTELARGTEITLPLAICIPSPSCRSAPETIKLKIRVFLEGALRR